MDDDADTVWKFMSAPFSASPWLSFLACLHLSAVGALGICVWATLNSFGSQPDCTPETLIVIFGRTTKVTSRALRVVSLVVYSVTTAPILNIGILLCIGLGIVILIFIPVAVYFVYTEDPSKDVSDKQFVKAVGLGAWIFATTIILIFIVDTELMIRRNADIVQPGESQWSFGQTLAMLLVVLPLLDTLTEVGRQPSEWLKKNHVRIYQRLWLDKLYREKETTCARKHVDESDKDKPLECTRRHADGDISVAGEPTGSPDTS